MNDLRLLLTAGGGVRACARTRGTRKRQGRGARSVLRLRAAAVYSCTAGAASRIFAYRFENFATARGGFCTPLTQRAGSAPPASTRPRNGLYRRSSACVPLRSADSILHGGR